MTTMCFVLCDHTDGAGKVGDGSPVTPSVLASISAVIAKQLNGEFAQEWGGSYGSRVGANDGSDVQHDQGEIEVAIFQNEDVSGAAGYHDRDPQGNPYIHVALDDATALTDAKSPLPLSGLVSHEANETSADPGANRWADRSTPVEEALETCDRVEDSFYEIDGIAVSNFLLKSAFDPGSSAPWDHMNVLAAEDGQTSGGYAIERQQGAEVTNNAEGVTVRVSKSAHVVFRRHESDPHGKVSEAYKRRKNHPASRTRRRGAVM